MDLEKSCKEKTESPCMSPSQIPLLVTSSITNIGSVYFSS